MTFSSCITEGDSQIVLDTSVVINLLATGRASQILQSLEIPTLITENVEQELRNGSLSERPEMDELLALLDSETLRVATLDGQASAVFFDLVGGTVAESLDDGEAATLAFALHHNLSAAIDEKKATRIATERYPSLRLITTVDIFAFGPVKKHLSDDDLKNAIFRALSLARMQVREPQFDWIAETIGSEKVQLCSTLKRLAKRRSIA
ncbi:hypothetical protein [Caballeronia sp. J97]|uniref:hypothetical protein n=1 Tax=Caballeronia sp. J97 TaxID=2805429 RepID=UPI002AB02276|nr:hypothetical protein [Caballeronia sp. J97]